MKLEVGMYLRYPGLDGDYPIIQKITKLETPGRCGGKYKVFTDKMDEWFIDSDYIEMSIKNGEVPQPSLYISDLAQEGDYVNGMKVNNIAIEDGLIYLHMDADECLHETTMLTGDNIESIVTKEQFEEIKYRVGE